MTLWQRWGRLFVSISYAPRAPAAARTAAQPTAVALDTITAEQTITEYPNPAPLKTALAARRRAGREDLDVAAKRSMRPPAMARRSPWRIGGCHPARPVTVAPRPRAPRAG